MRDTNRVMRTAVAAAIVFMLSLTAPAAAENGAVRAKRVEIRRTEHGVPHIKADTVGDVAFGFGYCQAEDHLINIMRSILVARGESALYFGRDGNIETDFWSRRFEVRRRAVSTYHKLDPEFREMLEGFAAGLTYYIELHRDDLPDWVQPISAHDIASHGMTGVMRFAFDRGGIIRALQRKLDVKEAAMGPAAGPDFAAPADENMNGSNMWALGPSRTKSGRAILMGNPHQPWSPVATYYEAHLTVPGKWDFYGSTFVGRPVLTTGFNANLGWTHTVNYPDLEEIYELDLVPGSPDAYVFDDGEVPVTRRDETVRYTEGEGSGKVMSETRTFEYTPLGPVILRTETKLYVLRSAVYEEFRFYEQWWKLSLATNLEEFRAALRILSIPMFNICYADREGNIFYLWNGTVPDLPHESHTAEAVPARRSSDIWTRFHDIDELPQLLNPASGAVQNCNMPPWFTSLHEPLRPEDYPAHFPDQRMSPRTQHSLRLLEENKVMSLEEVHDLKFSMRMDLADQVKDDLLRILENSDRAKEFAEGIALLRKWENSASAGSRGSVLFDEWWSDYWPGSEVVPGGRFATAWSPDRPMETPRGVGDAERAVESFGKALARTKEKWGAIDVAWGEVHRVRVGEVDMPVGGGGGNLGCFRVLAFREDEDGRRSVRGGDSMIFTVEFGDTPRAYSILGYSQSEVPGSRWESDQSVLFANNQMKRVAFTEAEIRAALVESYHPGEEKR